MSEILETFLRHERALKKYLARFFSKQQDIDDIAQETFLKVFATELRTKVRSPRKLMFRVAKHLALNELQKKINTTTDYIEDFDDSPVIMDMQQVSAEDVLDNRRKLCAFSKAVASLPPNCRQVFILRKFEGLSNKEIALRLHISVSGVEKHIASGLVKCSQYLRESGYGPEEFGHFTRLRTRAEANPALSSKHAHDEQE